MILALAVQQDRKVIRTSYYILFGMMKDLLCFHLNLILNPLYSIFQFFHIKIIRITLAEDFLLPIILNLNPDRLSKNKFVENNLSSLKLLKI